MPDPGGAAVTAPGARGKKRRRSARGTNRDASADWPGVSSCPLAAAGSLLPRPDGGRSNGSAHRPGRTGGPSHTTRRLSGPAHETLAHRVAFPRVGFDRWIRARRAPRRPPHAQPRRWALDRHRGSVGGRRCLAASRPRAVPRRCQRGCHLHLRNAGEPGRQGRHEEHPDQSSGARPFPTRPGWSRT